MTTDQCMGQGQAYIWVSLVLNSGKEGCGQGTQAGAGAIQGNGESATDLGLLGGSLKFYSQKVLV